MTEKGEQVKNVQKHWSRVKKRLGMKKKCMLVNVNVEDSAIEIWGLVRK